MDLEYLATIGIIIIIVVVSFIATVKSHGHVNQSLFFKLAGFNVALFALIAFIWGIATKGSHIKELTELYGTLLAGGCMELYLLYTLYVELFKTTSDGN